MESVNKEEIGRFLYDLPYQPRATLEEVVSFVHEQVILQPKETPAPRIRIMTLVGPTGSGKSMTACFVKLGMHIDQSRCVVIQGKNTLDKTKLASLLCDTMKDTIPALILLILDDLHHAPHALLETLKSLLTTGTIYRPYEQAFIMPNETTLFCIFTYTLPESLLNPGETKLDAIHSHFVDIGIYPQSIDLLGHIIAY